MHTDQYVTMMEVGQGHTPTVELFQHRAQAIEKRIVEHGPDPLFQRFGVNPARRQRVWAEATEEDRQRIDPLRSLVRRRLAADQPAPERVPQ